MNAEQPDQLISRIASAIGEPARVRMLYSLLDGHARTSTELAVVAGVSPSTASVHLSRLSAENLLQAFRQGKHRYYSLAGGTVASALEALNVVAAGSRNRFVPNTPNRLLAARTCYDHIAGALGVALNNRFKAVGWFASCSKNNDSRYQVTREGTKGFESLGINLNTARVPRRKFAYPCLDWSERQPHLAGSLAAALLTLALKNKWVLQDLDSRALSITSLGRKEMMKHFRVQI